MPWEIDFVQFNGTMTMRVVAPDGKIIGTYKTPNAEEAGRVLAAVFAAKQSFEVEDPWAARR